MNMFVQKMMIHDIINERVHINNFLLFLSCYRWNYFFLSRKILVKNSQVALQKIERWGLILLQSTIVNIDPIHTSFHLNMYTYKYVIVKS